MRSPLDSARSLLEPALTDGETWDEVLARLKANTAQLWFGRDCAMLTEVWGSDFHVWLAGGRLAGIMELRPKVEETARFWGLKKITIGGRPGWNRVLRHHGYTLNGEVLEKSLEEQI